MERDSLSSTLVPVVSYSSDEGVIGGVIYDWRNDRGTIEPFRSRLKGQALVSTRGFVEIKGTYEQTESWGGSIRSVIDMDFHHYTADNYFGIGNATDFSASRWDNNYYHFKSVGWSLDYSGFYPLYDGPAHTFEVQFGAGTEYEIPYIKKEQSSFAEYTPPGKNGGWINYLSTGFLWENRDRPFDARHGNYAEFELRFAPDFISKYALTSARVDLRQYFYLFDFVTIANRLEFRHVGGDVPYWKMSTLGDENTLRGYPLNRFLGSSSVAYTLELRSWLFRFPQFFNLKIGGQLFTDTGRVFSPGDDWNDLFHGYHQTVGFGGAISILKSDFILRGDIGFSKDVRRIYVGMGYLF